MKDLERLYHLQEIELSIGRLTREQGELEEALGETRELLDARDAVREAEETLEKARKEADRLRDKISSVEAQAKSVNQKLFGGRIRNPREVEALREKSESLKRRRASLEDSLLEFMIQIEEWEETLSERRARLAEIEAAWEADQAAKRSRMAEIRGELERLERERSGLRSAIPAELLSDYDYLVPRKGGMAVARVVDGTCGVCGSVVPRAFLAKMRSGEVVHCGECGRILVG